MLNQDITENLYKQGERCINLGNPKEALSYFEQVLEKEPDHLNAVLKKGNILGKIGKYEQAILSYNKALELDSNNVLALVNKGLAYHYLEQYDEAISCYDKVLELKPNEALVLYNKASSLVKKGELQKGLSALELAIKFDYTYKVKAKYDIDFQDIKTRNEFKRIVL